MNHKRKDVFSVIFYLISIAILIYLFYTNHNLRTFQFYLLLDLGFLLAFYFKYRKSETSLFYLKLFFCFLFINHITLLSFIVVQFTGVKFHYDILFQFLFFLFLFLTDKKNLEYINLLLLFALLVPPIALIIDHYYFSEYILFLFVLIYLEIVLTKKYYFIILHRKSNLIYIFYSILLFLGLIQFFYVFPKSSVLFHFFRFFVYILSFFPFLYYLRKPHKIENIYNIIYLFSVYFSLQLFIFVFLITVYNKNIVGKANENFFAMYFDWVIFISLFQLFHKTSKYKKFINSIFIIIIFILTYKVIILFDAKTTEIIIPLTIILTMAKYIYDKKLNINSNFIKKNLYVIVFFILYVMLYLGAFYYALETKNSSLMTRFFYWYVIYKYFIKNPIYVFTGLGEYEWGYLYKYLTFDLKNFPYLSFTDYRFFFHSHAHNDIISFLIGGGLIFLLIYFYLIVKILKAKISENKDYIFFSIIIICVLHGITEPFAFSPYTGYIFWLVALIFIYKYYSHENIFNYQIKFIKNIKISYIKTIKKVLIIFLFLLSLYGITGINLKYPIYSIYYFKHLPQIERIYNNREKIHIDEKEKHLIQKNLNLLKLYKPFEIYNYIILADYHFYDYFITNQKKYLENLIKILCDSTRLQINIFNYTRIKWIEYNFNINTNCSQKLDSFDRFKLIQQRELFLK